MDRNALIENLRTTLLWENVYSYIESIDHVNALLQKTNLGNSITVESASIQDSEDFCIAAVTENSGRIEIDFEMPFILCVNKKYNIQAVAIGNLDIPVAENYPYDKYDFGSMGKKELLSIGSIVSISKIEYEDAEIIGVW